MAWGDPGDQIGPAISTAQEKGDIEEMRRLLAAHPEYLRFYGRDTWLSEAVRMGDLPMAQMLVELGLSVNEPASVGGWSPLQTAAGEGHAHVVHWLLEHGADAVVNKTDEDGEVYSSPLASAAIMGHLEIVKLLVEHGANVHSESAGMNVLMHAEGHPEVYAYLRSVGANDLREVTPPDYETAHKRVVKHMQAGRGKPSDWSREIPGDPLVVLRHIPPSKKWKVEQTLFTVGLSDRRLPHGVFRFACAELRMTLPPQWPLTPEALADPRWNWPLEGFQRLIETLRGRDRWPNEPILFSDGEPLGPDTSLNGWMVLRSEGEGFQLPDLRWISIWGVFPVYEDEMRLARERGTDALALRFHARGLPLFVDPQRPSVAGDPEPE